MFIFVKGHVKITFALKKKPTLRHILDYFLITVCSYNTQIDRQVLNIESPVFEPKSMEAQFQTMTKSLGEIGTVVQQKRMSISRGHTHIGMTSASSGRRGQYVYFMNQSYIKMGRCC